MYCLHYIFVLQLDGARRRHHRRGREEARDRRDRARDRKRSSPAGLSLRTMLSSHWPRLMGSVLQPPPRRPPDVDRRENHRNKARLNRDTSRRRRLRLQSCHTPSDSESGVIANGFPDVDRDGCGAAQQGIQTGKRRFRGFFGRHDITLKKSPAGPLHQPAESVSQC
jgi:hypothetical protein